MGQPRFDLANGACDGVNTLFVTLLPYTPGTLAVFVNGQLKSRTLDDGWTELDPNAGTFVITAPPEPNDVIQTFFIDLLPALERVAAISLIYGKIYTVEELSGTISEANAVAAKIATVDQINAVLAV
jgi:hypothetical protein